MKVVCLWFSKPVPMKKLAENCLRFSPQIGFRDDRALFIEIGKCHRLYTEEGFLARLHVVLRRMELSAQIGIAETLPEALIRAKYQRPDPLTLPLEALIDFADPLNRDPVVQKYILKMIQSFTDLGISNLADFKKLPLSDLISRFGPVAVLCHQRISGQTTCAWPTWQPEEIIKEKKEFPYFEFYGELEPILFELKKQLDQIFQRLWSRSLKAQSLRVRIFCETNSLNPHPYRNFEFQFLFPQGQTKGALNVIKERLMRDFEKTPITTPIEGLETTVTSAVSSQIGQKNLLHNRDEIAEQLHSLLNQLAEAHGKTNIFHAELTEDRRPERSWRKSDKPNLDSTPQMNLEGRIPLRPTYLLRPEKIEIAGDFLHIRKRPYKILKWFDDVERISGGWLEGPSSQTNTYDRNYYQIELETGTVISVFQVPDKTFYLHGYFG